MTNRNHTPIHTHTAKQAHAICYGGGACTDGLHAHKYYTPMAAATVTHKIHAVHKIAVAINNHNH